MSRLEMQVHVHSFENTEEQLSFEVREVVSLLAAFQAQAESSAASEEDDYDPFSPGFPGNH